MRSKGASPGRRRIAGIAASAAGSLFLAAAAGADGGAAGARGEAFVRDVTAGYQFRSLYFRRDLPDEVIQEAWGLGGWIHGETGALADVLSFGGAWYFTLPLVGKDGRGGNLVLEQDPSGSQDGFGVLGEAYARLRLGDHSLTLGRQAISVGWTLEGVSKASNRSDASFIGRRDIRLLPLDFEAALAKGAFGQRLGYFGGYAWRMRQVNSDRFENLAAAVPFPGDSSGMAFGGLQWRANRDFLVQGSFHRVNNLLDMGYVDADYVFRFPEDRYLRIDTQYIVQESNGTQLTGRDFSTWNWNLFGEVRHWKWLVGYAMGGITGDGEEIRTPYSSGPSYLTQRIGENSKAGEHAWIVGTTVDFAALGAPGLSFDINYGQRRHRHLAADAARPLSDWDELATDLVYFVPKTAGFIGGTRMRFRWARIRESGQEFAGGAISDIHRTRTDLRLDAHLNIPFDLPR